MPGLFVGVGAVAAGAAVTGATTAGIGAVGAGILGGVVAGAVAFAGAELLGLNDLDLPGGSRQLGPLLNARSNNAAIPVIYGTRRVGGVLVAPPMVTGTADEYLHLFLVLAEGEVEAINTVWLDGTESTDAKYSGLVRINKHLGTDAQTADADAVSEITSWTTDHRLRGVAYIYLRLEYSQAAFSGIPEIHAEVEGQKLYDPRTTLTAFSNNPALAVWDYLTDTRYGLGIASSVLDSASFQAVANYCDQTFTDPETNVIARYTCDGILDTSQTILANLNALLTACRGMLIYTAGSYKLIADKTETAAFTFDEDNIVGAWGINLGNARARFNRVYAHFFNPDRSWQEDLGTAEDAASRSADDNGRLLSAEIQLPFTTNIYRGQRLAQLTLRQSRQPITVTFTATLEALENDVGDVVYVTHEVPGWTNQTFRIMRLELTQQSEVAVSLSEYEPTVYGDPTLPVADSVPATTLPDPFSVSPPTALALSSGANDVFEKAAIKATWTAPASIFVTQGGIIEIEAKKNADSTWVPVGETPGDVTTFHISPVEVGTSYDVRIRARTNMGVYSAYETETAHTVTGQSTTEKNITDGASLTAGNVRYTARMGFEFDGASPGPSIWINDSIFGNEGYQVQYNAGTPRMYVGDGSDLFMKYDGTDFSLGDDVEHTGVPSVSSDHFVWITNGPLVDHLNKAVPITGGQVNHGLASGGFGVYTLTFDTTLYGTPIASGGTLFCYLSSSANYTTQMDWSKPQRWKIRCYPNYRGVGTGFSLSVFLGMGNYTYASRSTPGGKEWVGFAKESTAEDDSWVCTSSDGTNVQTTSVTLTARSAYHSWEIRNDGAGTVKFYYDDVLKATHSTYVPSGTPAVGSADWLRDEFANNTGSTQTGIYGMFMSEIKIWQGK